MTTSPTSISDLSALISTYKADPEKHGNSMAERMLGLLTDNSVKNKIAKAAGGYASQISISLDDLIEEVRQEAVIACMASFLKPGHDVRSDEESAKYVHRAVEFAAHALVDKHLGSRTADGTGRSKGLSSSPVKFEIEETEDRNAYQTVNSIEADGDQADPALSRNEITKYMESIRDSEEKLHHCLTLYLEGYKQKEIAGRMGVDERTVRNYLAKAKSDLRAR